MKFIDREKELNLLESEFSSETASFVVIFGRRRTGKTTLINQFIKEKSSLYFFADTQNEYSQIKRFQDQLADTFNDELLRQISIDSWDLLFQYFCDKLDDNRRFVLAIDEFQSLVKSNKDFSSIFQRIFDTKLKNKNLMIILCGSLISMMYSETLAYSSPLYGRRTAQIKLQEINFYQYHEFYEGMTKEELLRYYSVTGGIPKYIELFHRETSLFEAIRKEILDKNKFLYYEPRFLLREEFSDVSTYFSILSVIAAGNHKLSNITSRLGVKASSLTSFIKKLIDLDILEKQIPVTEPNPAKSKRGLYYIKDNFIRFWFKFVLPYQSYLEMEDYQPVEEKLKNEFDNFTATVYEDLSKQTMYKIGLPFHLKMCGRWWDNKSEIDVIGIGEKEIAFGECKWSINKVGMGLLKDLRKKTHRVKWLNSTREEYFVLFSKSGFTPDLQEYAANNERIFLVDLGMI